MRRLTIVTAALVALPGVVIGPASASAAPKCAGTAADVAAARSIASVCKARVEIEADRTEFTQVFVNPDGTHTSESAVVPQRAKRGDGSWGPVDTALHRTPDGLAPIGTAANVRFSAGGSGPLVTIRNEGRTGTLAWPTPLPAPTVDNDTATYAGVMPGVDLVVWATPTGFGHRLVTKTTQSPTRVKLRAGGDGMPTSNEDGSQVLATGNAAAEGMDIVVAGEEDHEYELTQTKWAYATSDNSDGNTKDTSVTGADPSPAANVLIVGVEPGRGRHYRSFLQFPITDLRGKTIISAEMFGKADHTWACAAKSTYFYRAKAISSNPRQNWPGPELQEPIAIASVSTANEVGKPCYHGNKTFEGTGPAFASDLQFGVDAGWSTYTVGMSAASTKEGENETAIERYMRFFLNDYRLRVKFNTKPNPPDGLTVDGKPCATGTDRPAVRTTTPALRARVTDADTDLMDTYFYWSKWNGAAFADEPGSGAKQDSVPSGGAALMSISAGTEGGTYSFRAAADDSPSTTPHLTSNTSASCEWTVDLTPPAAPPVTSDVYKQGQTSGGDGITGHFTFASSPDTVKYLWGWSDPPYNPAVPTAMGDSVTIAWTPPDARAYTLYVKAIDRAGHEAMSRYQFSVATGSPPAASWPMSDPAGAAILLDESGNGPDASVLNGGMLGAAGRILPGNDGASRTAMSFDGVDDRVETSGPVIDDSSKNFSVAAWVKLGDLSTSRTIISQRGVSNEFFALEYSSTGVWRFRSTQADAVGAAANPNADSISPARLNTWTHLTVSYDEAINSFELYVNGTQEARAAGVTLWDANGPMSLGDGFKGSLAGVQVWERRISFSEAQLVADANQIGRVGIWLMEDVGPGPTYDGSGLQHDLDFHGGAQIPPTGAGKEGTGLRLDGVDDHAASAEPVLYTDQSFTVSAWIRLAATDREQAILSQGSISGNPGFALYFSPEGGGQWKLRMAASAGNAAADTLAVAPAPGAGTAFHHVIGVFDAQARQLRLYVNTTSAPVIAPMNSGWTPWNAGGTFLIGRTQQATGPAWFAAADIDQVRVYQGIVRNINDIR